MGAAAGWLVAAACCGGGRGRGRRRRRRCRRCRPSDWAGLRRARREQQTEAGQGCRPVAHRPTEGSIRAQHVTIVTHDYQLTRVGLWSVGQGDGLDLDQDFGARQAGFDRRAAGAWLGNQLAIDRVHRLEQSQVGQEDRRLDQFVK